MTSRTILLVSGLALTAALPKPPVVLPQNPHDPPTLPAGTHTSVGVCPGCGPNVTSADCALIHGCCKCCAKPNPCKPQQVLGSTADVGTERDGVATTAKAPNPSVACVIEHCSFVVAECEVEKGGYCREAFGCSRKCGKLTDNKTPGCSYLCEMTYGYKSPTFLKLLNCMRSNKCISEYPKDGTCLATDADAVQNITSIEQLRGDWWVLKGVNCGQLQKSDDVLNPTPGRPYPGGYDWYPCQHERFVPSNGHDFPHPTTPWVNNITYCGGRSDNCSTPIIDTVANVSLSAPGVVHHLYTDAPLKPQDEFWRVVDWPHPDYVFVAWCGRTPLVPYNGGIVLGRNIRSLEGMPAYVEASFARTAARFNVSWSQMCPSTNVGCP